MDGETDGNGEVDLVGAADATFAVRVLGPGHVAHVVQDVHLSVSDPLVVTVAKGATVVGRILPPRLVAQLLEEGGDSREGPGLRLHRDGRPAETHPADHALRLPLDDEGGFRFEGVAPGAWLVVLCWTVDGGALSGGKARTSHADRLAVATLRDLRDGEVRELDLDLSALERGTLRALVRLNGQALAGHQVTFEADLGPGPDGQARLASRRATTDAEGRLEVGLPEGSYRATIHPAGATHITCVRSAGAVFVPRGGSVDGVFDVEAAPAVLELVREDGSPIAGATAMLSLAGADRFDALPTDAAGKASISLLPIATFEASILPRAAREAMGDRSAAAAARRKPIPLGKVEVAPGAGRVHRLVVPASAGY
jgi:hypothetical protein